MQPLNLCNKPYFPLIGKTFRSGYEQFREKYLYDTGVLVSPILIIWIKCAPIFDFQWPQIAKAP